MARKYVGRLPLGGVIALCAILLLAPEGQGQIIVTRKKFTISGSVGGLSGVTMKGLPGPPKTDENGVYSVEVEYGWSGNAAPVKLGYTFEPSQRTYSKVTENKPDDSYVAKLQTFTIAGSTGVGEVTLKGMPGNPVSGPDGRYAVTVEYGWGGVVIPEKMGYRFDVSQRVYTQVIRDYAGEDYKAEELTYTISGTAGVAGISMVGLPGNVVTGPGGSYTAKVPYGWNGTATPTKAGHQFSPLSRDYAMVSDDYAGEDYSVQIDHYQITGSVGQAGVVLKGLPDDPVSDLNGLYLASVPHGFTAKVTPELAGYTFQPPFTQYTDVTENKEQTYQAAVVYYTIEGNAGIGEVTLSGLPGNPLSEASGLYSVKVPYGWTGYVTPTKDGYTFEPPTQVYGSVGSDQLKQDYKAKAITYTISGNVGTDKVILKGLPGAVVSGPDGSYSTTVSHRWSGTVSPMKPGYTFDPNARTYPEVVTPELSQDYYPKIVQHVISGTIRGKDMAGVPDVMVVAENAGTAMTDADGKYQLLVDYGWQGKVMLEKDGYTFLPPSKPFGQPVARDIPNQDFIANVRLLTITNRIAFGEGATAEPIVGVKVSAMPGGQSTVTGSDGIFRLRVPYGWSGELVFEKDEFDFSGASAAYSNVTADIDEMAAKTTPPATTPPATTPPATTPPATTPPATTPPATTPPATTPPATTPPATTPPATTQSSVLIAQMRQELDELYRQAYQVTQQGGVVPQETQLRINQLQQQISTMTGGTTTAATTPPANAGEEWPELTTVGPGGTPPDLVPEQPTMTLLDVLTRISEQTQTDIAVDATVIDEPVAVGNIAGLSISEALTRILASTEYRFKSVDDTYLVFKPIQNTFAGDDLREALQLVGLSAGIPIIPDSTVVGEVYATLNNVPLETALEIVLAGTPYVFKRTEHYYLVGDRNLEGPVFAELSITRHVRLNYLSPQTAVSLLSPVLARYVKAENAVDPNTTLALAGLAPMQRNTGKGHIVTVTASPAIVDRIVEELRRLDTRPRQILLESRVVVMEHGDLLNLGVEWGFPTIQAGGFLGTLTNADGDIVDESLTGIQIGYTPDSTFTDALLMALNLLEQRSQAEIMTHPQVFAQDGRQAEIRVVKEEWFMMQAPQANDLFYARAELEKIESGTILTITPYIGDNNDITLEMAVEVSDSIPRARGSELPVVTRRTARNAVTIENGGTVALAGLTENRTREEEKRVPFLSDVPLIGHLFRNTDSDKSVREIAVFVTAHLIPDGGPVAYESARPESTVMGMGRQPTAPTFRDQLAERLGRQNR